MNNSTFSSNITRNMRPTSGRAIYDPFTLVEWVFYIFLTHGFYALFIILGNVAVIVAFYKNPRLRSTTNIILISMAVADFLVGLIALPAWAYFFYMTFDMTPKSKLSRNIYLTWRNLDQTLGLISIYHLVYLHCLRCYSIVFPLRHRKMTKRPVIITMLLIWAIWIAFPPVVRDLVNSKSCLHCYADVTLVLNIGLPLVFVTTSNFFLWRRVSRSSRQHQKKDTKLLVTIAILITFLVVCYVPFMVLNFYNIFVKLPDLNLIIAAKFLHYFNSGVNPVVYALRNPDLGRALRAIVCRNRRPRNNVTMNQQTLGTAATVSNM